MNKFEQYNEDLVKVYETIPDSIVNALIEKDAMNLFGKNWHQMSQYHFGNSSIIYGHFDSAVYNLSKTVKKNIIKKELEFLCYKENRRNTTNIDVKEFVEQEITKEYLQLILNPVYKDE